LLLTFTGKMLMAMEDLFAKIIELKHAGVNSALCTLTETSGSVPRKAGSKMIVTELGEIYGTVGGGNIEMQIVEKAGQVIKANSPAKFFFNLEENSEMHCGGSVEVFIEPMKTRDKLIIFGAGHVGLALARLVRPFGFNVSLVDERESLLNVAEGEGFATIKGDFIRAAEDLQTNEHTFLVVTTPKHKYDEEVTAVLGKLPYKYLGMIGSRKKVALATKTFKDKYALSDAQIDNIDMPIGIPFNAQTPEEIAVSILAKLIDVKNS